MEETVYDVFVEIWNRAANFDPGKGKALGWIICMARRAVDRLRRGRRYAEIRTVLQEAAENGAPLAGFELDEASGETRLATRDLRRALDGLIKLLPS